VEDLVIDVGYLLCHAVASLGGLGHSSCYNQSASMTIGSGALFGLALLLAFRKILVRVGGP
jgi:hypothetical protein